MTIRVAILIFVVSFASITGWLATNKPTDNGINNTPTGDKPAKTAQSTDAATAVSSSFSQLTTTSGEEKSLHGKLESVIIPHIDIQDEPLEAALDFLGLKLRELESVELSSLDFVMQRRPRVPDHEDTGTDYLTTSDGEKRDQV